MSVSHDAPSDPTLARYLATWEKRMAKARKIRGPEKNTRKALTEPERGGFKHLTFRSEDLLNMPLTEYLDGILRIIIAEGGVNSVQLARLARITEMSARSALARIKAKLRAHRVAIHDSRRRLNPDGVLRVIDVAHASTLLLQHKARSS